MNSSVKAGLAALLEVKPRGPTLGSRVVYTSDQGDERVLRVVASQRWEGLGDSAEVGLVWAGLCDGCDTMFWQVSAIRKIDLHTACDACDVLGARADTIEIAAANDFISRAAPKEKAVYIHGVKRRGRVENHVLETLKAFDNVDGVRLHELVAKAVETMPAPAPDERDSRRQRVVRSIQQLSRERDGLLQVDGDLVICCK